MNVENDESDVDKLITTLTRLKDANSPLLTTISNLPLLLESLKELNNMIEMYDVKKSIVEQIKFLLVNTVFDEQKNNFEGHMLHTVLGGSSGCGKTSLGIILAKIWMSLGLLKKKEDKKQEKEEKNVERTPSTSLEDERLEDTEDEITDIHLDKIQDLEKQIVNLTSSGKFKSNVIKKLQQYCSMLKSNLGKLDNKNVYRLKCLKRELDKIKFPSSLQYSKCIALLSEIMGVDFNNFEQLNLLTQTKIPEENMIFTLNIIEQPEKNPVAELDEILNEIQREEDKRSKKKQEQQIEKREETEKTEKKDNAIQTLQTFFQNSINAMTGKMTENFTSNLPQDKNSDIIRIVSREDFCGQFVGHSAPKTLKLLQDNIGKVLFIDEAYSLINDEKDSYGHECLATLNRFMSENGDKIIIIFAGYKDLMEQTIFKAQPGLKRRCTWNFEIKEYSEVGLSEIFKKQLRETGWSVQEEVDLVEFFKENKNSFPYQGGSTLSLSFYCKIVYGVHVFDKGYENNKVINSTILNEALTYLKTTKKEEDFSYRKMFT